MPLELYPFKRWDPVSRRWHLARWKKELSAIDGPCEYVCGPAEVIRGGGTAGHVQSSPDSSGPPPHDLSAAAEPVQRTPGTSGDGGTGDLESPAEPASWGRRLLP